MKENHKSLLLLFMLLMCSIVLNAQPRNGEEALEVARQFLSQQIFSSTARAQSLDPKPLELVLVQPSLVEKRIANRAALNTGHASGFYIVNDESCQRFVIVSGDSRQVDILGFSDRNTFDVDNVPCALEMLLSQYDEEFVQLQKKGCYSPAQASRRAISVNPLVTTEWDQGNNDSYWVGENVYNKFCPMDGSKRSVTGCVATAMAQILYTHKQPYSLANKTVSYTTESHGIELNENMSSIPLNWGDMLNSYKNKTSSKAQRDAVGYLMYACGLAVHMDYLSSGSGASDNNVPYALKEYFGYNDNMTYCERDYYTKEEWGDIIQSELQAGRPVFYGGVNPVSNAGHAFIIDGCNSNGTYHINWGWGGQDNGDFVLSTLNADNFYVSEQDMVIGISPSNIGIAIEQFFAESFSMNSLSFKIGSSILGKIVEPVCQCAPVATTSTYGANKWTGNTGIAVFDTDFNLIKEYKWKNGTQETQIYGMGTYYPSNQVPVTFDSNTFKDGKEYYIAPYAKGINSSTVTRMRTKNGASDWYLAKVSGNTVTLTLMGTPGGGGGGSSSTTVYVTNITLNQTAATLAVGQTLQLTSTITPSNATDKTVSWTSSNTSVATVTSEGYVVAKAAGSATITCSANDGSGMKATCSVTVTSTMPEMSIETVECLTPALDKLTKADVLRFRASFKNTGATANVMTCLIVIDSNNKIVLHGESDTREYKNNQTIELTYECPLNELTEGASYKATVMYYKDWTSTKTWIYKDASSLYDFTVNAPEVAVTGVRVAPWSVTLKVGGTKQLTPQITPNDATNKTVTWTSDNPSVASVSSTGLVTAKSAGETLITCKANDDSGKSFEVPVQVLSSGLPEISFVSITSSNKDLNGMKRGSKLNLRQTFKNAGVAANIYTQVNIVKEGSSGDEYWEGELILKQFPANSDVSFDYEYVIPDDLPEGSYKACVMYYNNWKADEYVWYYYKKNMIDITVTTSSTPVSPDISTVSATINTTNLQNLTKDDEISLTTVYKNTGASLDDFQTAIVFLNNDAEMSWYGRGEIKHTTLAANSTETITQTLSLNSITFPDGTTGPVAPGTYRVAIMYRDYWNRNSWIRKDNSVLFDITVTSNTPVDAIYTDNDEDKAVYYDLQGRRIEKPTEKGVYIRNGKKILIK